MFYVSMWLNLLFLLTAQTRFNKPVRFVRRHKYSVVVFQSQTRQIYGQNMNIRQRKSDFRNFGKFFQNGFAHRVKRVLNRKTVVSGKSFDDRVPNIAPNVARRRFGIVITPDGFDRSAKNPVGRFGQSRVLVFDKADKTRSGRFQHDQIFDARFNRRIFTSRADLCGAFFVRAFGERMFVQFAARNSFASSRVRQFR